MEPAPRRSSYLMSSSLRHLKKETLNSNVRAALIHFFRPGEEVILPDAAGVVLQAPSNSDLPQSLEPVITVSPS